MATSKALRRGRLFKRSRRSGGEYPEWWGRVKTAAGRWRAVKLYTDLELSRQRLNELQALEDRRAAGYSTAEQERLKLPISDLLAEYVASLQGRRLDADHVNNCDKCLSRIIRLAEWFTFADVTVSSVERVLPIAAPKTVSYQNSLLKKIKAFVHWALPDGVSDPLRKLKRRRERGAKRNRARRALSVGEQRRFFATWAGLPAYRRLAYALAMVNGLRRSNIKGLTWGDVTLNTPVPYIRLQQKMGDGYDYVALHPYVVGLLGEMVTGMPLSRIVPAVPDVSTLMRDLAAAEVTFTNGAGERADFHGLRHTFATSLDATGCSRATKKRLLRHAAEDVTDGYAHAELAEMLEALQRLPELGTQAQEAVMSGTDSVPLCVPLMYHGTGSTGHNGARQCTMTGGRGDGRGGGARVGLTAVVTASGTHVHDGAQRGLPDFGGAVKVPESTAGYPSGLRERIANP